MTVHKCGVALCAISFALAFGGCGDDKPNDKLASEVLRPIADTDLHEGLEIANFQRENGQVDSDSANRYKVTYSYDLRLTKPLAEVVLANAKVLQDGWGTNAARETGTFFDPTALQNTVGNMQVSMAINQWVTNQGESFAPRRDSFLGDCTPCIAYWNSEDAKEEAANRRRAFLSSWIAFEELGFKDSAKIGDGVPREVWASFSKTEKGWQKAN